MNLADHGQLWVPAVWAEDSVYPPVIAHEYRSLYELIRQGQTFGAMLQIKDLFEVLLKLPVLLTASLVYENYMRQVSESGKKLLISLLEKPLSLGDWERIANTIRKDKISMPELQPILADICLIYSRYGITEWRNDTIGHGALACDLDERFKEDLEQKISLFFAHFNSADLRGSYAKIRFFMRGREQEDLVGPNKACHIPHLQTDDLCFRLEDGAPHSAYPCVLLDNEGVYFFDKYCH